MKRRFSATDEQEISTFTLKSIKDKDEGDIFKNISNLTSPLAISSNQLKAMREYSNDIDKDVKTKLKEVGNGAFSCQVCGFTKSTLESMRAHLSIHRDGNPYRCPLVICSTLCPSVEFLVRHVQIHFPQTMSCRMRSDDVVELKKEDSQDQGITQFMNYACTVCKLTFEDKASMDTHVRWSSCHSRQQDLDSCIKTKTKILQCRYCPYTAMNEDDLEKHDLIIHMKLLPYMCSVCPRTFAETDELEIHERTHSNESDKGFETEDILNGHMKTHSRDKDPVLKFNDKSSIKLLREQHQNTHDIGKRSRRKIYQNKKYAE